MANLLSLPERWRKGRKTTFNKHELGQILSIYGERVSKGEWRDYALDCMPDMAVFSIFRHTQEQPIYSVAKISSRGFKRPSKYAVYEGKKTIKQGQSLLEVLQVFREAKK